MLNHPIAPSPIAPSLNNETPRRSSSTPRLGSLLRRTRAMRLGLPALLLLMHAATAQNVAASKIPPAEMARAKSPVTGVVNLNTATESELALLPGIGPSKAQAIIRYRDKRKFKAPHDLVRVKGIGRKSFRALRSHLTVNGPTTLGKKPKK